MREVILDTETTGLDPLTGDRVTEIGLVEVVDFVPTGEVFHSYFNPQRDVPAEVTKITGLTAEFLADKPLFADVAEGLAAFIGEARIVAHNAGFDRAFLNFELARAGAAEYAAERWFDTLELARSMYPGSYNSLDALCKRFNISLEQRDKHGALLDARLLSEVYLELNGGRVRSLDLGAADTGPQRRAAKAVERPPRPKPLKPLVTAKEAEAHAVFIATLGEAAIWKRYE